MSILAAYMTAPSSSLVVITPSDSTQLSPMPRMLYIGSHGDLVVLASDDSVPITLFGLPTGAFVPIRAQKVMAATTASNIVGLL